MIFDETTHKVIPWTLTRGEADDFAYWLTDELQRHRKAAKEAEIQMVLRPRIQLILQSAVTRHLEDVAQIESLLEKLKEE